MTYVFRCRACGNDFEITATVAEYERQRAPECPRCGVAGAKRVYTPVMVMVGGGRESSSAPLTAGGGCGCGGACSCGH